MKEGRLLAPQGCPFPLRIGGECLALCLSPGFSPDIEPCQWAAASKPGNNRAHLLLHSGFFLYFLFFFPCLPLPLDILNSPVNSSLPRATASAGHLPLAPVTQRDNEQQHCRLLDILLWTSCCGAGLVSILQQADPADPACKRLTRARLCAGVGVGLSSLPSKAYSAQRMGGFKGSEWDD